MKPDTLTIYDLFQFQRRHIVPLFQRPYVWGQEKQWLPLWEDIVALADQILAQPENEQRQVRKHFIGAVVLKQSPVFGRQIPATEVIDGQQRLTTLQLLLLAIRDYIQLNKHQDQALLIQHLTTNDLAVKYPHERYKVWPTTSDQGVFEAVFAAGSPEALTKHFVPKRIKYTNRYEPRPRLVEAYLFFSDMIRQYVEDQTGLETVLSDELQDEQNDPHALSATEQRLEALVTAMTKQLELVVIDLEERDDPQVIFETLNARGEPLLPSDLIRNFVFLEATQQKQDVNGLYQRYWQPFDQDNADGFNAWKQLERQGRLNRPRLDLFFFHYLTYKREQEIGITHLFQEFRQWWSRGPRMVEAQLTELQHFSQLFAKLFSSAQETRLDIFAQRMRILDTSTVYPLL